MISNLERARRILASAPLVDGHNDLAWVVREQGGDVAAYDLRTRTSGRTDLARLREGRVGGQFWAVYRPCGEAGAVRVFEEEIALAKRIFATYPDRLAEAATADEVVGIVESGRIACLIGIEGGQAVAGSLDTVRTYRRLGVRYITLTHNCTTDWADSAQDAPRHGGLSPFGVAVVHEMNRVGMLVDLSHTSPETMHAALDVSTAPVIWSHAGAKALVDHPRNIPDDALVRLRANGGVAMVTFVPGFICAQHRAWQGAEATARTELAEEDMDAWRAAHPMPNSTLADVADHIDHARDVAGVDHVGIGSDFDGFSHAVQGLEDVSCFPALFAELIGRGWSDGDLTKLAGGNILRVMRDAERIAES